MGSQSVGVNNCRLPRHTLTKTTNSIKETLLNLERQRRVEARAQRTRIAELGEHLEAVMQALRVQAAPIADAPRVSNALTSLRFTLHRISTRKPEPQHLPYRKYKDKRREDEPV